MDRLYLKTQRAENLFNRNKTIKNAVLLIYQYYSFYVFMSEQNYLHKAYHTAATMKSIYPTSLSIKYCLAFLEVQLGNMDKGQSILEDLSVHRSFFKANSHEVYNLHLALEALVLIKSDKSRAANKKIKQITSPVYLAFIEIEQGGYETAYEYISYACNDNDRSFPLFLCMYWIFVSKAHVADTLCLFPIFAKWSCKEGIEIDKAIDIYQDSVTEAFANDLKALTLLYNNYKKNWLLELLCLNSIARFDYSQTAFNYYREAETKQIYVDSLDVHLVRAAYVNKYENISHFTLEQFLTRENDDYNLKSYIYHLLTSNEKYSDLREVYRSEIIQFAVFSLDLNERGRYFYSIYVFFLKTALDKNLDKKYIKRCSDILYNRLLLFDGELSNPDIFYVWVFDKQKKNHEIFKASKGKVTVKSVSREIRYLCLDESGRRIINEKINFKKSVDNADTEIYKYFYDLEPGDSDLLIALAREYMDLESLPDHSIDVLNSTLENKNISRNFKMQITAALGNILASQNRYDRAISYYKAVDENFLSDKYIEQMLISFVNAKEYEKASRLIVKKAHCVSDRSLFFALKQLAAHGEFNERIADVCYELLLKSWYDKSLIDVVVKQYRGSQRDLIELSSVLANMQAYEFELDKKILENSIWMHRLDTPTQKVFLRVYNMFPEREITQQYIYYLCYEILVQNKKIDYSVTEILEKYLQAANDHLTAYALSHLYLTHSVATYYSQEVLSLGLDFMEEEELLFPYVSEIKDKSLMRPYIIKNRPYIYYTLPNKTVYLYYRVDSSPREYQVKMKYFMFGIYLCSTPHFYNERLTYYFSEEMANGSINTKENEATNIRFTISEPEAENEGSDTEKDKSWRDSYFTINNALIYQHMFRYDEVEKIISDFVDGQKVVKGHIL